ncbi:SAM-dependent methyltransferase [Candidatus Woesearchaeota archaeon]|jgi:phosphatidylethanolamine/phosphatidyl-N-methylethanolamine N-methyltransferase|nr:SAM-dependent methyltransferase [Candidatus Woesearchaeota archaeon]MBT4387437.1 SAM-dependent methyltransferase [Candidatus Woesearchaeota archaeon]MBT4595814.1 SAM-dependent methyltransferase [Candidatus Woesearchaeota archaeon]MBT5741337.1 SAM-dependent methyltransferase [Candidatus Woesearchaeota archaeon]MBT6505403.1 SAM-dependent methyltransferase [Candidatus Woesearchaeota archaeon]
MNQFLKQFFKHIKCTGAIAPSSKHLSKFIVDLANLSNKKCIIELGSGTGVFTKEIVKQKNSKSTFFCLEINKEFVSITKKNCPGIIVYNSSADKINKYLLKHNEKYCDCIISGLPWAAFDNSLQINLLNSIYDSLSKNGVFLTFAYIQGSYLPSGMKFKQLLLKKFKSVEKSKIIWKNLPPAFVYICKK